MKLKLYDNIFITEKNIINPKNIDEFFEEETPVFESNEINGQKITSVSFFEIFENLENPENIKIAIVEEYPFFKNKKLIFQIEKMEFIAQNKIKFSFKLNVLQSFSFEEIFNKNQIFPIDFCHIKEIKEFEKIEQLTLKKDNFFQNQQPIPISSEKIQTKIRNFFWAKNEKDLIENAGVKFWAIAIVEKAFFDGKETDITFAISNNLKVNNAQFSLPFHFILIPISNKEITFNYDNNNFKIIGKKQLEKLQQESLLIKLTFFDYPINNNFSVNEKNEIVITESGFYIKERDGFQFITTDNLNQITSDFIPEDQSRIFDWKIEKFEAGEDYFWRKENEIILNFSPFKEIGIGIFSETNDSANYFSLQNDLLLPSKQHPIFFSRQSIPSFTGIIFVDSRYENFFDFFGLEEKPAELLINDRILKITRSLTLPTQSNNWEAYQLSKANASGFTDFAMPAAGFAIAASLAEGPVGWAAAAGFGLKTLGSIVRRRTIKNKPNHTTNAATDGITESLISFDSKILILNQFSEKDQQLIAFHFHKNGYYFFGRSKKINELFNQRKIFHYLKVNESIIHNSVNFLINDKKFNDQLLLQLISGFHQWNFDNNWEDDFKIEVKSFNFYLKNPEIDV